MATKIIQAVKDNLDASQKDILGFVDQSLADAEVSMIALGPDGKTTLSREQRTAANFKSIFNNKVYTARSQWGLIVGKETPPASDGAASPAKPHNPRTSRSPMAVEVLDDDRLDFSLVNGDGLSNHVVISTDGLMSCQLNSISLTLAGKIQSGGIVNALKTAVEYHDGRPLAHVCKIDGIEHNGVAADVLNSMLDDAVMALKSGDADAKKTARIFLAAEHVAEDVTVASRVAGIIEKLEAAAAASPAPAPETPATADAPASTDAVVDALA